MKRYISSFLLLLALFLVTSLPAFAQEVISPATTGKEPRFLAQINGTVYVNTNEDELYALDASGQPQLKISGLPDSLLLLSGDDDFLAVETVSGNVLRFTETESGLQYKQVQQLDWSAMADKRYSIMQGVVTGGRICLLAEDNESASFYSVFFFDKESGAMLPDKITDAWDICNYEAGIILVYMQPFGLGSGISVCDVNTLQAQKLLDTPEGDLAGLSYDKESGIIAITGNGAVYTSKNGAPFTEGGYLNINMQSNVVRAVLPDENTYVAMVPNDLVLVCDLASLKDVKPLHIAGGDLSEETVAAFRKANPGTPVVYVNMNLRDTDILALQLVLRTGDVDIFVMPTGLPIYDAMLEKGFALDLSNEQSLTGAVSAMYPRMADQVTRDGRLYGLPVNIRYNTLGYNPALFTDMNLPVPKTMLELLDQLQSLAPRDDAVLMYAPLGGTSEAVLQYLMNTYLSAVTAKSPGMDFNPELFRNLMAKWEAIAPLLDQADTQDRLMESPTLFCDRYWSLPGEGYSMTDGFAALPLAINEGGEKIVPASLCAMIVNPASNNQAEAKRFLTFYAQNLNDTARISMCPDENDPVKSKKSEEAMASLEQDIQKLKEQLATCAPEEKKQLTEQLLEKQESLAQWQADQWTISAEEINAYRAIAGMLVFGREDVGFFAHDKQIHDLINQFNDRGIDSARFCDAFLSIWEMAQRED